MSQMISCPMCSFQSPDEYETQLHVESIHLDLPPNSLPTIHTNDHSIEPVNNTTYRNDGIHDSYIHRGLTHSGQSIVGEGEFYENASLTSDDDGDQLDYVICPRPDCREPILIEDLETHTEIHESAEDVEDTMVEQSSMPKGGKLGKNSVRGLPQDVGKEKKANERQVIISNDKRQFVEDGGGVVMCDWDVTHGPGHSITINQDGLVGERHEQGIPSSSQKSFEDRSHDEYGNGSTASNARTTGTSAVSPKKGKSRLSEFAKEFYGTHLTSHKRALSQDDRRSLSPSNKSNGASISSSSKKEQYHMADNHTKPRFGGYALSPSDRRGTSVVSMIRKKRFVSITEKKETTSIG